MAKPFTWDFEARNVTFKLRVFGRPRRGDGWWGVVVGVLGEDGMEEEMNEINVFVGQW